MGAGGAAAQLAVCIQGQEGGGGSAATVEPACMCVDSRDRFIDQRTDGCDVTQVLSPYWLLLESYVPERT